MSAFKDDEDAEDTMFLSEKTGVGYTLDDGILFRIDDLFDKSRKTGEKTAFKDYLIGLKNDCDDDGEFFGIISEMRKRELPMLKQSHRVTKVWLEVVRECFAERVSEIQKEMDAVDEMDEMDETDEKGEYLSDWFCNEGGYKFPTHDELCSNVPAFNLRGGEYPDCVDPTFYCGWEVPSLGFKWVLMFYDPSTKVAFGYAKIEEGEYGPIDMDDIRKSFESYKGTMKSLYAFRETFKNGCVKKSKMSRMFTF